MIPGNQWKPDTVYQSYKIGRLPGWSRALTQCIHTPEYPNVHLSHHSKGNQSHVFVPQSHWELFGAEHLIPGLAFQSVTNSSVSLNIVSVITAQGRNLSHIMGGFVSFNTFSWQSYPIVKISVICLSQTWKYLSKNQWLSFIIGVLGIWGRSRAPYFHVWVLIVAVLIF